MLSALRDPSLTGAVANPEMNDAERRLADLVKVGRVVEVDYSAALARVGIGDEEDPEGYVLTGWIPWKGGRAGGDTEWHPPEVGEVVEVHSEGGELQNGIIQPGALYTEESPAPGDRAGLWRKRFKDGAIIEYDRETHEMTLDATDAGAVTLRAGGCEVTLRDGVITLRASRIVTDGETSLDGGTRPVAYQGAADTNGDTLTEGAGRVLV